MIHWLDEKIKLRGMSKADFARCNGGYYARDAPKGGWRLVNVTLPSKTVEFHQVVKVCKILGISIVEFEKEFERFHGSVQLIPRHHVQDTI